VQDHNQSVTLNSGRQDLNTINYGAHVQSQSKYSQMASNGTLPMGGVASQAILGLKNKETMTFRGQLESLE